MRTVCKTALALFCGNGPVSEEFGAVSQSVLGTVQLKSVLSLEEQ